MSEEKERNKGMFCLVFGGAYTYLLLIGWLLRLGSQKYLFSEIELMQTAPLEWGWFYKVSFLDYLDVLVIVWLIFQREFLFFIYSFFI